MKRIFLICSLLLFVVALFGAFCASAFAQEDMRCSKPAKDRTVCYFGDGRANVTELQSDGTYASEWYTAEQWTRYLKDFKIDGTLRPVPRQNSTRCERI